MLIIVVRTTYGSSISMQKKNYNIIVWCNFALTASNSEWESAYAIRYTALHPTHLYMNEINDKMRSFCYCNAFSAHETSANDRICLRKFCIGYHISNIYRMDLILALILQCIQFHTFDIRQQLQIKKKPKQTNTQTNVCKYDIDHENHLKLFSLY